MKAHYCNCHSHGAPGEMVVPQDAADAAIASLEAKVNEQARLNGMGGSREAKLLAKVEQFKAALRTIANADRSYPDKKIADDCQYCARTALETPVSTLCAVCDQIKELHPATHAWTAKETSSRFPRAMLDPDFKAETACKHDCARQIS
jgi:hypothetical protein